MSLVTDLMSILENFVDDLNSCVNTHRLEELLNGDDILKGADVGSKPEPWTRKHLIEKLLDMASLEWEPEIYGKGQGYPDFGITNLDIVVIGEDKSINKINEAEKDIKDYLNNRAASRGAEYGIATDGIEWKVFRIELGGDFLDYSLVANINLRNILLQIARDKKYISPKSQVDINIERIMLSFINVFSHDRFNILLTKEAPKKIRMEKKRGIKEFYDLYIELLFGEGKRDYEYDTTLFDDIKAPYGVTDIEKRIFMIKLVNRLLFIKFLENKGILPDNFLAIRVENYQRSISEIDVIGGGIYKSQLEPLFFKLLNTKNNDRISKHRGSWFDNVPYLNGSLFSPDEKEMEYDVDDRMLITLIKDLVEGHKLQTGNNNGTFDPSILGNVFEMTINYISEEINAQKKEGAYYTPNDVIKLITSQTILPKMYDVLVDVYSKLLESSSTSLTKDESRNIIMNYKLGEILRFIEQREGYFSDPDTIREAYDELGKLKMLDPACGSGHFLTAVLDEIHRVRLSLLRGLKGTALDSEDDYKSKKELVLSSLYGVDINPIAIEIAKLRVWLKMIENGWEESYGELPNININIVDGNSLIGLPAISKGQATLKKFEINLENIKEVRQSYKEGKLNRRELSLKIKELKPELTNIFIENIYHNFSETIYSYENFDELIKTLDSIYPTIKSIKLLKKNDDGILKKEKDILNKIGFKVYRKSAKMEGTKINKINTYKELFNDYKIVLERKPTKFDVSKLSKIGELSYQPFHWMIEFPETVIENDDTVKFDIIIGNPPYGDILSDLEKRFTKGYTTSGINDIAAQFLERELDLLDENGYFGNVITLKFVYQDNASIVRDLLKNELDSIQISCFTTRPSKIFDSSDPRVAIITGIKKSMDNKNTSDIRTSVFIRFNEDDREQKINNITYESTHGLYLGNKIGSGEDLSLPKIGNKIIRNILEKLKNNSEIVFRDLFSKSIKCDYKFPVWRKRGPQYWINPFLENIYGEGNEPTDFDPMYFKSDLEAKTAFLIMQSSLFYMCWMVYGDQRHLNWSFIESFPFPEAEIIETHSEIINELAPSIWKGMVDRFEPTAGRTGEIKNMVQIKTLIDDVDDLMSSFFGLSEDEIRYVKSYETEYGR